MTARREPIPGDVSESRQLREAPLGPGSLTWRIFGQRLAWLLVPYTGTLQNMHPAVGQSLQEVSIFFGDPLDRFVRSIPPIMGVVYDDVADQTGQMVRNLHRDVKGRMPNGERYHALDPDTFWWTHATFIDVVITVQEHFGTPLTEAEKDQVIREGVTWWRRYGLSMRPVIDNYPEFKAYMEQMHDSVLESNPTTDFAVGRLGPIAVPKTLPLPIPETLWTLAIDPVARGFSVWMIAAMMSPRGREILGLSWSKNDQLMFSALRTVVRLTWPCLPQKMRYFPRAYNAMKQHGL
jgi:uncharacterized protein (DUF2236 family)